MENLDVWSLIQNGHFENACKQADTEFENTGDIFILRNKVYALLLLKKYDEVIRQTKFLIEKEKGESEGDFILCGIAYWFTDEKELALEMWLNAAKSKYTDASGGIRLQVIRYFAGVRLVDEDLKKKSIQTIVKLCKSKKVTNWPGPLGSYIIDKLSADELLSTVVNINVLGERQSCEAYFVMAVKELEQGHNNEYLQLLNNSISYGASTYLEPLYYLASGELNQVSEKNEF